MPDHTFIASQLLMTGRSLSSFVLSVVFFMVSLLGCKEEAGYSLFDPNVQQHPDPVIGSLNPTSGLAGVTPMTITGSNFSPVPSENAVYFNSTLSVVVSASASELVVRAPIVVMDSIRVKITVQGAERFSNVKLCQLNAAVYPFGNFLSSDEPYALARDTSGNVYVSNLKSNLGDGIKKITPEGIRTDWAPRGTETVWSGLRVGPAGILFAVRDARAIFTIAQGATSVLWAQIANTNFHDIDFDSQGDIWAVGNNQNIYRFKPDKSSKAFPFVCIARAVRVFGNYLYVGGKTDSTEGVFRFPILNADSLGPAEQYFNLSVQPGYGYNSYGVHSVTFNSDGEMYVGTDSPDGMLIVRADRSASPFYPGLMFPKSFAVTWGKGAIMYVARTGAAKGLYAVNTQKTGSPYFGQ